VVLLVLGATVTAGMLATWRSEAHLADVPEHGRALGIDMLVECDPGRHVGEQPH
jgi:hypothetical protein